MQHDKPAHLKELIREIDENLKAGLEVLVYTSRGIYHSKAGNFLSLGRRVMDVMIQLVQGLSYAPSFFIAKGGITSSEIATRGLNIKKARVIGQALPGVPVWLCGDESKFPGLPYIVFPGNVGQKDSLESL